MNPKIRGYHFEVGPFLHKSFRLYANESSFYLNWDKSSIELKYT